MNLVLLKPLIEIVHVFFWQTFTDCVNQIEIKITISLYCSVLLTCAWYRNRSDYHHHWTGCIPEVPLVNGIRILNILFILDKGFCIWTIWWLVITKRYHQDTCLQNEDTTSGFQHPKLSESSLALLKTIKNVKAS